MNPYKYICEIIEKQYKIPCKPFNPMSVKTMEVQVSIDSVRYQENNDSTVYKNGISIKSKGKRYLIAKGRIYLLIGEKETDWEYFYNFVDVSKSIFNRDLETIIQPNFGSKLTTIYFDFSDFLINIGRLRELKVKEVREVEYNVRRKQ